MALGFLTAMAAYSIPFIVVVVENMRNGAPDGGIWWSYYALGLPVLAIGIAVGQIFGTLIKSDYAAPALAAIVTFVLIATVGQMAHLVAMNGDAWYEIAGVSLVGRLILGAAVCAAAFFISHAALDKSARWKRREKCRPRQAVAATSALALGVIATAMTPTVQVDRAQPESKLCTGTAPQICLWLDDAKYLPQIQKMQKGMHHLPARFKVPSELYETGLSRPGNAEELYTVGGRFWNTANGLALDVGMATYPSTCVPDGEAAQQKFTEANFNILGFLLRSIYGSSAPSNGEGGGPPVDMAEIDRVAAMPPQQQNSWVD